MRKYAKLILLFVLTCLITGGDAFAIIFHAEENRRWRDGAIVLVKINHVEELEGKPNVNPLDSSELKGIDKSTIFPRRRVTVEIKKAIVSNERLKLGKNKTFTFNRGIANEYILGNFNPKADSHYMLFIDKSDYNKSDQKNEPISEFGKRKWEIFQFKLMGLFPDDYPWFQVNPANEEDVEKLIANVIGTRKRAFTHDGNPSTFFHRENKELDHLFNYLNMNYPEQQPAGAEEWAQRLRNTDWPEKYDRKYWWNTAFVSGTVTSVNRDARTMQVQPSTVYFNDKPITSDRFTVSYPIGNDPKAGTKYMLYLTHDSESDGEQDGGWTLSEKPFSLFPSGKPILEIGDRSNGELKWLEYKVRVARLKAYKNIEKLVQDK